ncbi:MAG: hypothetical protein H5T92_05085, partial [Synergistales bacterium]|nr:hypothetical protein [Synergistales bacterium]
ETIYFGEFLERLFEKFGIVVGREEDIEIIRRNNIYPEPFGLPTIVNEDELRKNKEGLRQHLEELGYAVSYADGVTIVTVR